MTEQREAASEPPDDLSAVAPAREPPGEDWRAGLPAELGRVARKFATLADALRSYAALEKRLGRSVTIPAADAPAEEVEAFHARLGRPADPSGYAIAPPLLPPGAPEPGPRDAERLSGFLAAMHKAGAPQPVVQAAVDWYAGMQDDAVRAAARAQADAVRQAEEALRRDWGESYERRLTVARRAARQFGGDALGRALEDAGLGNHPAVLHAFARIGEEMSEGALLSGAGGEGAADAQSRIDALVAGHFGKPSYQSPAVQGELRRLYQNLYGADTSGADAG